MRYISTRGEAAAVPFNSAVEQGLAPDGGLYVPEYLPDLGPRLEAWETLNYPELCAAFFEEFASDWAPDAFRELAGRSHAHFDHAEIAPLRRLGDGRYVLELFHGPTLAFKDFALQLLGNLYEAQIERTGNPIAVLGATSGDTGAAAIHGLSGKNGVRTFILYPDGRISPLQERQMACTGADDVFPLAIQGTFDDAQTALKEVFADAGFAAEAGLSAVNSINLARILAQCVYYLYAWFRLPPDARERTRFVVPTGNFGNVLAGWMIQRMGVPMAGFRVATNQNDILHRFFQTGVYERSKVAPSVAPSMDIQGASNFERFLYYVLRRDAERVRSAMAAFRERGRWSLEAPPSASITSSRSDDDAIRRSIARVASEYGYVVDPHTACGFDSEPDPNEVEVVLATAHPAKFPDTIEEATERTPTHPTLEALKERPLERHAVEPSPAAIKAFIRSVSA